MSSNVSMQRTLGNSDLTVSALGAGCWAISGPFWLGDIPLGWGATDDSVSVRAIKTALDIGINFFDTGDTYGAGHGERLLGAALSEHRHSVIIATKFGNLFDETSKQVTGTSAEPNYIKTACEDSLKRLQTDYIDLYQFHLNDFALEKAAEVRDTLETLVDEGKIRYYGWSTDFTDRAAIFSEGKHCIAIQHEINVLKDNPEMLAFVETHNLASINRGPLAMGLLSGKYNNNSSCSIPEHDVRTNTRLDWLAYFKDGKPSEPLLQQLSAVKDILCSNNRSLVQGSLAWLWGRSKNTIPIPGFRTPEQITETARAMEKGALTQEQITEIKTLLTSISQ